MYLVKSPLLLKWYYSSLVWHQNRSEKVVYLTFDDGPVPVVTDFVLNTLKDSGVKATFFCIGDNIRRHPELFDRLKQGGHAIGNHTYNHLRGWKTADEVYLQNYSQCQELTGTHLFRPPYGRIRKSQVSALRKADPEIRIIMWDVLSGDFDQQLSPEKCAENVIRHTTNGSIIVFHDSIKAFDRLKVALPAALQYLSNQGYQFHTL